MDQIKIGKFIQERRKKKKLTQSELAEKLNVTDRAISKWENGVCLPDVNNIQELCKLLEISINDLFSGQIVDMKDNEKILEKNLLELAKQKEENDKLLLLLEVVIGILSCIILFVPIFIAALLPMEDWQKGLIIFSGFIPGIIGLCFAMKLEQVAGYYKCSQCNHCYVPSTAAMYLSRHIGRTRYMKCPECGEKSWQKKVISKGDNNE